MPDMNQDETKAKSKIPLSMSRCTGILHSWLHPDFAVILSNMLILSIRRQQINMSSSIMIHKYIISIPSCHQLKMIINWAWIYHEPPKTFVVKAPSNPYLFYHPVFLVAYLWAWSCRTRLERRFSTKPWTVFFLRILSTNPDRIHGTGIFTYMNGWFLW